MYVILDLCSEESDAISSGENVRQLMHSTSTEELKKQGLGNYDVLKAKKECDLQIYLFAFIWLIFAWIQTIGYSVGTIWMQLETRKRKKVVATKSKMKGRGT